MLCSVLTGSLLINLLAATLPLTVWTSPIGKTGFTAKDVFTLRQPGCSIYIFDFEKEFPDLGKQLSPQARNPRCNLAGLATMGGPLFKRMVVTKDKLAGYHVPRGLLPAKFAQHVGAWWLTRALRQSPNLVQRIEDADIVYIDDFCYMAWSEAKLHNGGIWGPSEELYVNPDTYLGEAYTRLVQHPAFMKQQGANFVFFHSHPALMVNHLTCLPPFGHSLHLVVENHVRSSCRATSGHPSRPLIMPYASFPLYPTPDSIPPRPTLLYFRASCGGRSLGKGLRKAIVDALKGTPDSTITCEALDWEDAALHEMGESRFCLIAAGDTSSSRRLTEAVLTGCVPVLVGPPFPALPLANVLHYELFSLAFQVSKDDAPWMAGQPDNNLELLEPPVAMERLGSLRDIPGRLTQIGRMQYERLVYQLSLARHLFSYVPDPDREVAGLCDVAYSKMCHHVS